VVATDEYEPKVNSDDSLPLPQCTRIRWCQTCGWTETILHHAFVMYTKHTYTHKQIQV